MKRKRVYKLYYILIAVLLTINAVQFLFINSVKINQSTSQVVSDASAALTTPQQFILKDVEGCPNRMGGNPDASLKIKYFYNELCPYCRQEAPILDRLVSKRGGIFYIQMFDTDKCREASIKAGVNTIPFFVFEAKGESNSGGGFVKEEDLENFICNVTQGC